MAEETKTEETTVQIGASLSVKDPIKGIANNEIDETIQKLSETTLEPYTQQQKMTSTAATTVTTATANKQIDNKEQEQNANNNNNDVDMTNLIINYLPPTMSEGTLATLFSPYGLLERCKIVVDLQTLRSRGYGFVKYDNPISAERALNALNGYELNGKKLKVAFARSQCKAITNSNLYLTNIPPHFNGNNLKQLFQDFGKIIECRVLMDQNGQSRGVGFVRMDTHHNAIQALQAMDQYIIDQKYPPLLVKLAQRRVPRRFWQDNQQNNSMNNGGQGNKPQNVGRSNKQKRYYPNQQQRSMPAMNQMSGGGVQPQKRGYYRPRNMNKGGYPSQQPQAQQQQPQQQQPRRQYYAQQQPMYADAGPYGMPAYGQHAAAYGAPPPQVHQPMAPSNVLPSNPPMQESAKVSDNANKVPSAFNVLVFNLPKHFNVDHVINIFAKFGPVQSVKIKDSDHRFPKKGSVGIISFFYFDDAQRAQNETNRLELTNDKGTPTGIVLETVFESPSSK